MKRKIVVRVARPLIMLSISALLLEGGSRIIPFLVSHSLSQGSQPTSINAFFLDEFEMPDRRHPQNWLPKPGYSASLRQVMEAKERSGRILAIPYLKEAAAKLGVQPDENVFRINKAGYKGPELVAVHPRLRVLTIGDSCTFGSLFDRFSYPRVLERELCSSGLDVEVVNGGVEGYSTWNVLLRIEDYEELKPQVSVIYIGWNNLFSSEPIVGLEKYSAACRLIKQAYRNVSQRNNNALSEYRKEKHANAEAPEVSRLEGYYPPFLKDLTKIIEHMQSVGSRVVLVTLPGLFILEEQPGRRALEVGQMPTFTDNPFVLAKLTEQYNINLRRIAAQKHLQVIDLEQWSKTSLTDREQYFLDSVHLTEEGQERLGRYMAEELLPMLQKPLTDRER